MIIYFLHPNLPCNLTVLSFKSTAPLLEGRVRLFLPLLASLELPPVLCLELRPLELPQVSMPINVVFLQVMFSQPRWWGDFMCVAFLIFLATSRSADSYNISTLTLTTIPEPYLQELCCRCIGLDWASQLSALSVAVFWNGLWL